MKHLSKLWIVLCLFVYGLTIQAQSTVPATGGNATGTGGTVSYTIGQVVYSTLSGTIGTVSQGVQQPYEISIVNAIENTEGINLEYKVYPNPTSGLITLTVKPFDNESFGFKLYDLNGILLQDKKVESEETEVIMTSYTSSVYFLKVIKDNQEVKVFKIIKR